MSLLTFEGRLSVYSLDKEGKIRNEKLNHIFEIFIRLDRKGYTRESNEKLNFLHSFVMYKYRFSTGLLRFVKYYSLSSRNGRESLRVVDNSRS